MTKEFEICPLCGEHNWIYLAEVITGEPYPKEGCKHLLWDPLMEGDFLNWYLKHERNDQSVKVPQFHALNLDVVPIEALETNRQRLEKVLKDNLHEVNGWWFGCLKEREATCKELITFLKPLCEFYNKRFESSSEQ